MRLVLKLPPAGHPIHSSTGTHTYAETRKSGHMCHVLVDSDSLPVSLARLQTALPALLRFLVLLPCSMHEVTCMTELGNCKYLILVGGDYSQLLVYSRKILHPVASGAPKYVREVYN